MSLVELEDLAPGEDRGRAAAALERYRLLSPTDARDPLLDQGYRFLHAYFGPRDEIERREVVDGWADSGARQLGQLLARYRMILALDADGSLAGARDCYAVLDPAARLCVVYLAHALVAPEHRRGGLAPLLRAAGATLGREHIAASGLDPAEVEIMLAVEQEPIDPEDTDSHVRLTAYGRAGFKAIDPAILPYCQPDFRDLATLGVPARPLPLLAVVRRLGHEQRDRLPRRLAEGFVRHLYAVFATHCRPADMEPPLRHALDTLTRWPEDELPLTALPRTPSEAPSLTTLLRERALTFFPDFSKASPRTP